MIVISFGRLVISEKVEKKIVEGIVHKTMDTYIGDILKEEKLV